MKRILPLLLALAVPASAAAVDYFWNNSGTDMNSASSYSRVDTGEVSTVLPGSNDLVWFHGLPEKQPHLTADLTLDGIRFASTNDVSKGWFYASMDDGLNGYNHCGWVMTGEDGAVLTLTKRANLGQSENNQAVINHCSYGTNRIECAVALPNAAKIAVSCGKLFLDGPVSLSANGELQVRECTGNNAALVLAAANPDFCGQVTLVNCNFAVAHPEAFGQMWRLTTTSENGGGNPRYIWNMTGGEFTNTTPFQIWMNKCEATVFAGPPMRLPNVTLCPDSSKNHVIWAEESLTVGSVSNKATTTSGMLAALDYCGAGTFHVLGDFGPSGVPGVTNALRLLDGTVVLHDPRTVAATPVSFGQKGKNTRHPRLGIPQDLFVKAGLVPGGTVFYYENCNYGGWAAYGGDHTVTMEAATDGVLKLRGWKGDTTGLSANLNNWNGSDWWLLPGDFHFGAEDADGTVTLAGDIDVNRGDSNAHFCLGAFQGGAFVAGRLAGSITNSVAGFLSRQIRKETGDGAVAIDGTIYIDGEHYVSSGGLLLNGATAGSVAAKAGGWLGGTGTIHALSVQTGGALRPGELGGTLTSDGMKPSRYSSMNGVAFAEGSTFVVDIGEAAGGDDVHGCLELVGSGYPCKATGTITVVPNLVADLAAGRTVKILDWSGVSNPTDDSLFNVGNWVVDADPDVFSKAELSVVGQAMYLKFSLANTAPTAIFLLQ